MLASYTNLRSSPCVKCKRLMDPNAQFPTVRTRVRTKTADSQHVYQWQAFHKGCVWEAFQTALTATSYSNSSKKKGASLYIAAVLLLIIPRHIIIYILRALLGCRKTWAYVDGRYWGLLTWCRTYAVDASQPANFLRELGKWRARVWMSWMRLWTFSFFHPIHIICIPLESWQSRSDQKAITLK